MYLYTFVLIDLCTHFCTQILLNSLTFVLINLCTHLGLLLYSVTFDLCVFAAKKRTKLTSVTPPPLPDYDVDPRIIPTPLTHTTPSPPMEKDEL